MRIAMLTTDGREMLRSYQEEEPIFGTAPDALIKSFARQPELELHVISCTQQPVSSRQKLAPTVWFHSLVVPKFGWLRTGYQGCIRAVRKKLSEIQPDLVHGQGTERDCAISAVFSRFPNVVTIHGNMVELARSANAWPGTFLWLGARLENFTLKRTGGVFCNSRHTENLVRSRTQRCWLVPNPVREPFLTQAPNNLPRRKCILLNVGVITPNKRQIEVLDMMQRLRQQGNDFECWFVGRADANDAYATAFLRKIQAAEQAGFARYERHKSASELIECFDQASALVHFPKKESFGLVVAEALARNLKLFGARVGGIVDIAAGVQGAELFEPDDLSGLERSIAKWIRLGSPISTNAAELMRQRYHPHPIARRHLEIYQEVLSSDS